MNFPCLAVLAAKYGIQYEQFTVMYYQEFEVHWAITMNTSIWGESIYMYADEQCTGYVDKATMHTVIGHCFANS